MWHQQDPNILQKLHFPHPNFRRHTAEQQSLKSILRGSKRVRLRTCLEHVWGLKCLTVHWGTHQQTWTRPMSTVQFWTPLFSSSLQKRQTTSCTWCKSWGAGSSNIDVTELRYIQHSVSFIRLFWKNVCFCGLLSTVCDKWTVKQILGEIVRIRKRVSGDEQRTGHNVKAEF